MGFWCLVLVVSGRRFVIRSLRRGLSASRLDKAGSEFPLVNPSPDTDGAQWDEFLQAVMADDEPSVSFE
jgi:hypothetical protein